MPQEREFELFKATFREDNFLHRCPFRELTSFPADGRLTGEYIYLSFLAPFLNLKVGAWNKFIIEQILPIYRGERMENLCLFLVRIHDISIC